MLIEESWVNRTENYRTGDSGLYEPFTNNIKKLFTSLQRTYGRCISKVYIDMANGAKAIGWVFLKIARYEDTGGKYLQETWVTLHESQPEHETTYHYKFLQ